MQSGAGRHPRMIAPQSVFFRLHLIPTMSNAPLSHPDLHSAASCGSAPAAGSSGPESPAPALARLALLPSLFVAGSLGAQTTDETVRLPEVSVEGTRERQISSPKFTAPLVDTPQTVSVIPQSVFNQQGAASLADVLRNTPGISYNAGENGFASGPTNFSLRGFDTTGSIFVDGVRDSGNYARDTFNLDQVEVAKGPASDNGRGGPGGYVNLVTKTPVLQSLRHGTASLGFDEHDSEERVRATIDVNQPLSERSAVRVNALVQDGGVPGRAVAERNGWAFAPSVAFGLGTPTRFVAAYQHLEQNNLPDWGVPGALIDGMINHAPNAGGAGQKDKFYGHASDYDDVTSDSLLGRIEHDFSPALRISNQTRWSQTEREALYTVPTGYAAATRLVTTQRQGYSRENTSVSNLTNLAAAFLTGSLRHTLSAGLEFSREESSAGRYPTNGVLGNPGSVPVDNPDPNRALTGFVGLVPIQTSEVTINNAAVYLYDTVEINDRWQLTGGLRADRYKVEIDSETAAGAPQGPDGYRKTETTVGGKLGLVFKPRANASLYASFGFAALPPGSYLSNPDISRDGDNAFPGIAGQNNANAKTQESLNYEIGTKWSFHEDRLTVTAAAFRTEKRNVAFTGRDTLAGGANDPVVLQGYGKQIVEGVELGVSGMLSEAWTVFGGVVFLDSERRHSAFLDQQRRNANAADYGTVTSTNGDELAFTPNTTANFWTTYRLPFGLTLGGGLQYVGSSYLGRPDDAERIIPNGNAGELPGYTIVNALLAYEVNQHLTLRLNVDNVTDKFYAASANWPGSRVSLGAARSFLLSADLRF